MAKDSDRKQLRAPRSQAMITREEIQDVLLDDGYTADARKEWLKSVLTDLSASQASDPKPDRERLIDEVKNIIDEHQDGAPKSDDVL